MIVSLGAQSALAAQKRIALVIGNSTYKKAPLNNPANDAADMSSKLKQFGFQVETLINVDNRQMIQAINRFGKKLNEKNSVGLFFFAGHGVQVNNNNYLLPLGAEIDDEADVEFEAINAARILSKMSLADNGLNLMILDACRNNPFSRGFRSSSRGLTFMRPASGSLILYATEPGNVAADGSGRNGLFTEKLLSSMDKKGLKVEDIFKLTAINVSEASHKKQVPWSEGVILGDFYFSDKVTDDTSKISKNQKTTIPANMPANFMGSQENIFWGSVDKSPSVEGFKLYLEQYPSGHYKKLAQIKIKQLNKHTILKEKPILAKKEIQQAANLIVTIPEENDKYLQKKLTRLISQAKQSEKALRLTSPKDSSAMHYYSQVLAMRPDHLEAQQGMDNIFNKYLLWSEQAIAQQNYDKAKRYLNRALIVKPKSETALAMYNNIDNQETSQPSSSSDYSNNEISNIKFNRQSVFVAMPPDGKFNSDRNIGSGKKTSKIIAKILSSHFRIVKLAKRPKSKKNNLLNARKQKSSALVIPEILHWEDRNTFWSGKPDKIRVKLTIYDVNKGKVLTSKTFNLNSEWSMMTTSNEPEQLLIVPVKKYFSALFVSLN